MRSGDVGGDAARHGDRAMAQGSDSARNAMHADDVELAAANLIERIAQRDAVAVAFSGGVDSAVVASAAYRALGADAVAVTGVGPALSRRERDYALEVAQFIGIRHVEVEPDELSNAGYVANAGDRCYHCKSQLYDVTRAWAKEHGVRTLLNGTNADDLDDYRPGLMAADEYEVSSPLAENGLGKSAVRSLARHWSLPVADKPASPCLASRVSPGVEVTAERLGMIEAAEEIVRRATGLEELRVRFEAGALARIEIPAVSLPNAFLSLQQHDVANQLRELGFRAVALDLDGFRSGSLNALVPLAVADLAGAKGKLGTTFEKR